jgi:hypothetical protein
VALYAGAVGATSRATAGVEGDAVEPEGAYGKVKTNAMYAEWSGVLFCFELRVVEL